MNFDDLSDKLSVLKKLHVSKSKNEVVVFYKKPYNANCLLVWIDDVHAIRFDLEDVSLLSLNSKYGLLVQYIGKIYPFKFSSIVNLEVK